MTTLFISYARVNLSMINPLLQELRDWGFTVWIDVRGIKGGTTWSSEIARAIKECDFFLLFVSRASVASDSVRRELDLAFRNQKPIIPLRLEKVDIPIEWDYQTAGIQWIEYEEEDWKSRLSVALGGEPDPPGNLSLPSRQQHPTREKRIQPRWAAILVSVLIILALMLISFETVSQFLSPLPATQPADASGTGTSIAFPSATPTIEPTATKPFKDPEAFVRNYFEILTRDRNYELAWSLLTPAFQNRNSPEGYDSYVRLWKNIERVNINSINFYENTEMSAKCDVNLTYFINNGNTETYDVKYHLIFDNDRQTWLFESP
jgi:hypothetical protein